MDMDEIVDIDMYEIVDINRDGQEVDTGVAVLSLMSQFLLLMFLLLVVVINLSLRCSLVES